MSLTLISFKNVTEKFEQLHHRPLRTEELPKGLRICPECSKMRKPIGSYERTIHYLAEGVKYIVHYYYCDQCRASYTPLPPAALPNVQVGLDVLCHEGYLHTFKGHSFEEISEHLETCHGIQRGVTSIRHDLDRLAIFVKNSAEWFRKLLEAYYTEHNPKIAMLDECFLDSFYVQKICLSTVLEPATTFLLGINPTRGRTNDATRTLLEEVKRHFGEFDAFITDLAAQYPGLIREVFTHAVVQNCVFHFFRLLYRKILTPLTSDLRRKLTESTEKVRSTILQIKHRYRGQFQSKVAVLYHRFFERVQWCLKKKSPLKRVYEFRALMKEVKERLENRLSAGETSQIRKFREMLREIRKVGEGWSVQIAQIPELLGLQEALKVTMKVRDLFRKPEAATFHQQLMTLGEQCQCSPYGAMQYLGAYLEKYQDTLGQFLQWGIHKTTSLLEKFFGRFKQNTKNGKGARTLHGYHTMTTLFQLIWNTTPARRRKEKKLEAASPVQRLWRALSQKPSDFPEDPDKDWYEWIPPLTIRDYRKRLQIEKQRKIEEFKTIQQTRNKRAKRGSKSGDWETRAQERWQKSKTLAQIHEVLEQGNAEKTSKKDHQRKVGPLAKRDKVLVEFLSDYPEGLTRTDLYKKLNIPRTTIYDILQRLQLRQLVAERALRSGKRGRPKILFYISVLDPG